MDIFHTTTFKFCPCGLSGGYHGQPDTHLEKQASGNPKYLWLPGKQGPSEGKIQLCWELVGSRLHGSLLSAVTEVLDCVTGAAEVKLPDRLHV